MRTLDKLEYLTINTSLTPVVFDNRKYEIMQTTGAENINKNRRVSCMHYGDLIDFLSAQSVVLITGDNL